MARQVGGTLLTKLPERPLPELSKNVVALLQYLAPGFLMAWVFFGMTSHNKPVQFERVVQVPVFTVFIQVAVSI